MTLRRFGRLVALMLFVPLGVFLLTAGLLGHVAVNRNWREPADGITIYVQSNGVHTGVVLPAVGGGIDWRARVRASDLPDPRGVGQWLAFGWGDRDFYLNTPRWQDMHAATIASALVGSGRTLVHVDHLDAFAPDAYWRPLRLRPAEYARLAAFVAATFADRPEVIRGYTARDVFYTARGHYSALRTCNVWTGDALRSAGVRVGAWTVFEGDVMRWIPRP